MNRFALLVVCILATLNSIASDFEKDGLYYNITSLSNLTVELVKPDNGGYTGDITIPETVEWSSRVFSVASINREAFSECNIGTLSIKDHVKNMNDMRWGKISYFRLEDSEIPLEVDESTRWTWNSGGLDSVYIGRNITSQMGYSDSLFGDSGAESVVFGSKVTAIPAFLFYDTYQHESSHLKKAVIPDNVKSIGSDAFRNTALESITAFGAKTIGSSAFEGCKKLKSVEFSDSLETIGYGAFSYCSALADFVLPENSHCLREIRGRAFEGCTSLKSFTIPQGVISIGSGAFSGCNALETINIPQGVIEIGSSAFQDCSALEAINIPASVLEFGKDGNNVFKGCTSVKTITVGSAVPVACAESTFDFSTYLSATLKVPAGASEKYKAAEVWKNFSDIQEDASISDDICTVEFITSSSNYYGKFEVSVSDSIGVWNDPYKYYTLYYLTKAGATVTIKVIPNENYKLSSLTINGNDVTEEVSDNTYTMTVTGSMSLSIDARFEYDYTPQPEPEPIFLTIKQADNGSVRQRVREWDSFTFYVEPAEGWRVHTVTLNGQDITSNVGTDGLLQIDYIRESAILSITYEQENSAVSEIVNSKAKVYSKGNTIIVTNAEAGEPIRVYNEAGVNVATRLANSDIEMVTVEKGHIYIVELKGKTVKLSI